MKKRLALILALFCVSFGLQAKNYSLDISTGTVNYGVINQLQAATAFTYEADIFNKSNNGDWPLLFGSYTTNTNRTIIQINNGLIYAMVGNGANTYAATKTALATSKWVHLSVVFDGTQATNETRLKLYIDGVLAPVNYTGTIPSTTATTNSAFVQGGASMRVDNQRIWSAALAQATITAWMSTPLADSHPNYTSLVSNYLFNEGSGTVIKDEMGVRNGTNADATYVNEDVMAAFNALSTQALINQPVTFINASAGSGLAYKWTFSGGTSTSMTAANPVASWPSPGKYDVKLVVKGASALGVSGADSVTKTIEVLDPATLTPATYYVSTTGNDANSGLSPDKAWKSLTMVNNHFFIPGDSILFKSGNVWNGMFFPKGMGTSKKPIVISKYGGTAFPVIHADTAKAFTINGGAYYQGILLLNQDNWTISNLEVTNDPGHNYTTYSDNGPNARSGIRVWGMDRGAIRNITIKDNYVHHVWGDDSYTNKAGSLGGSGGICVSIFGTGYLDSLQILNNHVKTVNRVGIYTVGNWQKFESYPHTPGYYPQIIRGNLVEDCGGDGICPFVSFKALCEYNVINGAQKRSTGWSAGMWSYDCDSVVYQYNEICNLKTTRDGMAFDCDSRSRYHLIQYNYTHDNEGGVFLLYGPYPGYVAENKANVFRYNLSINDGYGAIQMYGTSGLGGMYATKVYNNTFYSTASNMHPVIATVNIPDIEISNNIFCFPNSSTWDGMGNITKLTFKNNIVYGAHTAGEPVDATTIKTNPLLVNPAVYTMGMKGGDNLKLNSGSPAIAAGKKMSATPLVDFWGNPVNIDKPCIGAFEFSSLASLESISTQSDLLQVYPVPARDRFVVNSKQEANLDYVLLDFSGKAIATGKLINGNNVFDCSKLNNGIYFLQAGSGQTKVVKSLMVCNK